MYTSTITNIIEIFSQKKKKKNDLFKPSFIQYYFRYFVHSTFRHIIIIYTIQIFFSNIYNFDRSIFITEEQLSTQFKYFHRQFHLIAIRQFNQKRKKKKREIGRKKRKGEDGKFKKQRNSISLKTSVHAAKRLAARSRFC